MNATIDIKTPAGKSLEGFPETTSKSSFLTYDWCNDEVWNRTTMRWIKLHPGDVITITILP